MILAIMQPYLFPYIGYYQLINAVDKFVVYDDVAFIKQGWINRNNMLLNKKKHLFFAPVKSISSFKKISETEIDYKFDWTKKTLLTFEQSYKKAPFHKEVMPILESVFLSKKETISELAFESLFQVSNYLELKTGFQKTSSIYNNQELKGEDRVIDICLKEKTKQYINPIGGQELYQKENFSKKGITLNFIKTHPITYKQYNDDFVPWLSIVDVLMFNPKEEVIKMLNQFELI
ncbi:MAG: WbqC family protein [Flavobacterium sp.]|nr:WbqC family protein [Flavobacterium sp.]